MTAFALGIDLGTSGVRSAVVAQDGTPISEARGDYGPSPDDASKPENWWRAVTTCIARQMTALGAAGYQPDTIERIGVDGTSGSLVLVDAALRPVTRALMYSDGGFSEEAQRIARHAPDPHITQGAGSSLARALALQTEDRNREARHLLHQADFIIARLRGQGGASDENNTLKLGYDPGSREWPVWFDAVGLRKELLPNVFPAGKALGRLQSDVATELGLPDHVTVHAGTTDSLAAFLACIDMTVGHAVTSLGTTLAIKVVSNRRIDAPEMGLYSHRLGGHWLVGGASNSGGGVLKALFSSEELTALSAQIDPQIPSALEYYPLTKPGERFPINDPNLQPKLFPRPESDVDFLAGILESIARIEAECYALVAERGGPKPITILTAGGGSTNVQWTAIRERVIGLPVLAAEYGEAAIGAARLTLLKTAADLG